MSRFRTILIPLICTTLALMISSWDVQSVNSELMPPAPRYEEPSQWYIHDQKGTADIFYIISTETGDHLEAKDTCHYANTYDPLQRSQMLVEMAAVDSFYTGKLNYYSPFYRQASMNSFVSPELAAARTSRAIEDVKRSWQYYLTHFNQGRPFVLAGYSQGAAAVVELMREMPDSIACRMVAAYVIGYKVTKEDLADIPLLRPARGATDWGVTVGFNSVASPEKAIPLITDGNQLCINPVNWRMDSKEASFVYQSPEKSDTLTVRCDPDSRLLIVKGFETDEVLPVIGMPGNYHNFELRFYRPYIQKNIADRVAAYFRDVKGPQPVEEELIQDVERSAGCGMAYPRQSLRPLTPAPQDKKPFAMIYYGRHGSCYLSKPSDYDAPYKVLASADSVGKLTPLGRDVLGCLTKIRNDAYNHWGELTDVGVSQLRGIAWRMAERFPEIFCQDAYHLGARSLRTTCSLLSMEYTMNQIAKFTRIRVYRNASQEFSYYLNHQDVSRLAVRGDSAALQAYDAFARKYSDGSRLAQLLFSDTDYVRAHVDATTLSDQLFKVAGNIQNTRLAGQVTLYDLFTKDEIHSLWKKQNAWWYFNYGGYVHHAEKKQALQHQLLRNCFYCADTALKTKPTAIFHFTDETSFVPFVCLLGVNGYGLATDHLESLEKKGWADYRLCPMGANLQFILYRRNPDDKDVLMQVLLNEEEATLPLPTDVAPYYHLSDFYSYYQKILEPYEK